jgi:DNA-directed RNA polymerase specialized sigma24 family protein
MKRDAVDFHSVPERQWPIDARLRNWARWCRGSGQRAVHPMFRGYKPEREGVNLVPESPKPVDSKDAMNLQRVYRELPQLHRLALKWHYVYPVNPRRMATELGLTLEGLGQAVIDARDMLKNRGG